VYATTSMIGGGPRFLPIWKRSSATSHCPLLPHWRLPRLPPNHDVVQDSRSCGMRHNHGHFKPFGVLAVAGGHAAVDADVLTGHP
jgi:hypothetical protein